MVQQLSIFDALPIQKDNNVKNANFIYVGQVLKIGAQKTPAKPKENLVVDGYLGKATISAF